VKTYNCWCEDIHETEADASPDIEAFDGADAATEYAQILVDCGALDDVCDHHFHIMVKFADEPPVKYRVTAEPAITFFAEEVK
jgi:hypothetical protein